MHISRILAAALAATLMACGSQEPSGGDAFEPARLASLPVTLEGFLEITNFEGDGEADGGGGEVGFGSLKVGGNEYLIEIDARLFDAADMPESGGQARVTLGAQSRYGEDSYVITALTRL